LFYGFGYPATKSSAYFKAVPALWSKVFPWWGKSWGI